MHDGAPGLFSQRPTTSSAVIRSLTADFSLEMTPREAREQRGVLQESLPPGSRVYVTCLPQAPFSDVVAAATSLAMQGMRPVPHIAARSVDGPAELDRMVGQLAEVGVTELLVIAGSVDRPRGTITESLQVLRSGVLDRWGMTRVGVAGHPEGHPGVGDEELTRALRDKNAFAADTGREMYLLTQFCFEPGPIVSWERRIRDAGNRLPVHIGLPGLTSPARLVKFGLSCGVGPSLKALRTQFGGIAKLARTPAYYPDQTLLGLASALRGDAENLIRGVHFFPFGATAPTVEWAKQIAQGQFQIDDRQGRLAVTA